jgi:hypothetical protein
MSFSCLPSRSSSPFVLHKAQRSHRVCKSDKNRESFHDHFETWRKTQRAEFANKNDTRVGIKSTHEGSRVTQGRQMIPCPSAPKSAEPLRRSDDPVLLRPVQGRGESLTRDQSKVSQIEHHDSSERHLSEGLTTKPSHRWR